jgi:hypothetical protein
MDNFRTYSKGRGGAVRCGSVIVTSHFSISFILLLLNDGNKISGFRVAFMELLIFHNILKIGQLSSSELCCSIYCFVDCVVLCVLCV